MGHRSRVHRIGRSDAIHIDRRMRWTRDRMAHVTAAPAVRRTFYDKKGLKEHYKKKDHDNKCRIYDKYFQSPACGLLDMMRDQDVRD
ncbi:hypothetical protein QJS10_CPB21g01210 [Acorus calamus]|uniref:Uncharacterized protein n=1 Tax=Acorus calamus TaxID=4465 RepID=A0AAV9C679_ACOCL|nr:hypothetical protein QJS10_CPB21g01210 [Acorus calamus]